MRFLAVLAATAAFGQIQLGFDPNDSLAAFRLGEEFLKQNNYQSAANQFRAVLTGNRQPPWVVVWSHVNLGRIFERTGQRERAVIEYRAAAETGDNTGGARDEALAFLKSAGVEAPRTSTPVVRVPPGVLPAGPGVTLAAPVRRLPAEYTEEARTAELQGTSLIGAVVGAGGKPREMQIVAPLGLGLDEKAMEAIAKWDFYPGYSGDKPVDTFVVIPVDFTLPPRSSRWHLIRVTARPPEGVSRPVLLSASYPPGEGIGRSLMDHARVISALGRQATVTLSFGVGEDGQPAGFKVDSASDEAWGPEAVSIVRTWRFSPAAVRVPFTVILAWGQRNLGTEALRQIAERMQE